MTSIQSNTEYDYNTTTIQMGFRRTSNDLFESVSKEFTLLICGISYPYRVLVKKVKKKAKIRNGYNQVQHLTQDTVCECV